MLKLTCHACDENMEAETEDDLAQLGAQHAAIHGHTPDPEHVRARIRHQNKSK